MVLVVPIFLPPEPSYHPRSPADGATFRMESTEDSAACSPESWQPPKCQGWAKKTTHGVTGWKLTAPPTVEYMEL